MNSLKATRFRQWATRTLKEYIVKGFALNDDMLRNGAPFGQDYFDELLARIRDICASERRVWQKVTDIFQECSFDYDRESRVAREFFITVQNKMHFAATGQTAAEIVDSRADAACRTWASRAGRARPRAVSTRATWRWQRTTSPRRRSPA